MSGVIVQLKKFFSGTQIFPKTKTKAVYDEQGNRLDTTLGRLLNGNTVTSSNADYAEIGMWSDGNPNNEDRIGYFVSVDTDSSGIIMDKAMSTSDVVGVTVEHPAFSAGADPTKFDDEGNLLPQYSYVAFVGFVKLIDNGSCVVKERCIAGDDGTAIPSNNSQGYWVMDRIDANSILVLVSPNGDSLNRIQTLIDKNTEKGNFINRILAQLSTNAYIKDDDNGKYYKIGAKSGKLYFEETEGIDIDVDPSKDTGSVASSVSYEQVPQTLKVNNKITQTTYEEVKTNEEN